MPRRAWATLIALTAFLLPATARSATTAGSPTLTLSRAVGPPTSRVVAHGSGFQSDETVDISFDDHPLMSVVADGSGAFQAPFRAPKSATPGASVIVAVGRSSGSIAQTDFLVRTDWRMYQFSPDRTGSNPYENVLTPDNVADLELAWTADVGWMVGLPPVIGDGVVYATSYDGNVHAVDAQSGAQLWTASTGSNSIPSNLAVTSGLVFASGDQTYAFDGKTGEPEWVADVYGATFSGTLPTQSLVYTENAWLWALDGETGAEVWHTWIGSYGGPPSYASGSVFVTTEYEPSVLAIDASTGRLLWGFSRDWDRPSSPAVADGVVYATSTGYYGGSVYALDARTGDLEWRFQDGDVSFDDSPVVTHGHVLVAGSSYGVNRFYRLDARTGLVDWSVDIPTTVGGLLSPLEANGVVYFAGSDHTLYALDVRSGATLWTYAMPDFVTSPIVADGSLYVGSFDHHLYAFRLPQATAQWEGT